jgi:hexosaminidase
MNASLIRIIVLLKCFVSACLLQGQEPSVIPRPVSLVVGKGFFFISPSTKIKTEGSGLNHSVDFLNDYLQRYYGFTLGQANQKTPDNIIVLNYERMDHPIPGSYRLDVTDKNIYIAGENEAGVFYGIQSLIQLLPVDSSSSLSIPQVKIEDYPRFAWRGLHLDVGRHFFPVDNVKRYIDYIALHKMNYFHWHLTEDQGWRIQINKYPRLTEIGSCRNGTIIGRYPGKGNDSIRHCGYYTQNEIKDVIKYAADRYITIIPEIELPGHASAALTAYPYLGCTGGPYQVQQTWGVFNDVFCAGNDSTFQFLQDVLDEVIALFPGKYIHIGGDECPKTSWKKCPKCQKRIKENALKDEHELQSYFITRIEKYINTKGKQIIGWDEILEGGLAPNAAVMSWRGEQGGIEAARQNHDVIMTPGQFVYFDHSQKKNEDSVTIGGYVPLETVYNYEPVPAVLTVEQAKHVLGAQANVWTEYIGNIPKLEYMLFPRLSALSEVLWTPKENRNWADFEKRLPVQFKRYELWKTNFSKAYYDLKASILPTHDRAGLLWKLESNLPADKTLVLISVDNPQKSPVIIRKEIANMTADNGKKLYKDTIITERAFQFKYSAPVQVMGNSNFLASLYFEPFMKDNNKPATSTLSQKFSLNKATGKNISLTTPPVDNFPGNGGSFGLVNGVVSDKGLNSIEWLGWLGTDMEAKIDFGKQENISMINVHTLDEKRARFYRADYIEAFGSLDGISFKSLGKTSEFQPSQDNMGNMTISFSQVSMRYLRVLAKSPGTIPEGQPGAGNPARMLIDEIQVN